MNGFRNAVFIVFLMACLVAVDYMYTISDMVADGMINQVNTMGLTNTISTMGYSTYQSMRAFCYTAITGVMVPFLVFLTLFSSLVNRNQSLSVYLISSMVILIATPIFIYIVGTVMTNLLNVSILDPAYMYSVMLEGNNFMYILIVNLLLSLASFVFVKREVHYA